MIKQGSGPFDHQWAALSLDLPWADLKEGRSSLRGQATLDSSNSV